MTSKDFACWLKGFYELDNPKEIEKDKIKMIRDHLALVFIYEIDPSYSDDPKVQQKLQDIHDGKEETPNTIHKPKPSRHARITPDRNRRAIAKC